MRNEAADRLRAILASQPVTHVQRQLLDEAIAAAKAEGAREAMERLILALPRFFRGPLKVRLTVLGEAVADESAISNLSAFIRATLSDQEPLLSEDHSEIALVPDERRHAWLTDEQKAQPRAPSKADIEEAIRHRDARRAADEEAAR